MPKVEWNPLARTNHEGKHTTKSMKGGQTEIAPRIDPLVLGPIDANRPETKSCTSLKEGAFPSKMQAKKGAHGNIIASLVLFALLCCSHAAALRVL